ncbi:MAG TPA: 2-amino-4-hydroxy-6-hydroxymethyldihydropteridine diphosphokinase [Tepidisphaeraceae bacterium]|nr:2-amino-4-hydroxy-6-hydroxymethyldihydropteridine diphosphokinase [Tepidisphaeraceae bacterium]
MPNNNAVTAYIGVGSNLGDREGNIRQAMELLQETPNVQVQRMSKLLDNPAVGGPEDSPRFLNAAVEVRTTLKASELLKRLLEIEQLLGRQRHMKWEPRIIDLDLLLYGNSILSGENLMVPHPLMHERRFVLEPLAEIAPNAVHPVVQVTVASLLQNLLGGKASIAECEG